MLFNVGHGDMQVRTDFHTRASNALHEHCEEFDYFIDEDAVIPFFRLFKESTEDGSQAAVRKMRKIVKRQTKKNQEILLNHSVLVNLHRDTEMLTWPNSPLLVMLQFVDPNMMMMSEAGTLLHHLCYFCYMSNYFDSIHEKQLILAKQLIEHGANVNAACRMGETPLHIACNTAVVTNLDFVELLLEKGADPNVQNIKGRTPLMDTIPHAPGAAKYLLNWPTTDANIIDQSGASFLVMVRSLIPTLVDHNALTDDPEQNLNQHLLKQWTEIEDILVERGAHDVGIKQGGGFGANAWTSVTKNGVIFGGLAIFCFCLFIGGYAFAIELWRDHYHVIQ
jgi:hypothetical protein